MSRIVLTGSADYSIMMLVTKRDKQEGGDKMHGYGQRLRKLRGNKSLEKVAKDLGIATSTLTMYENEQRVPRDHIKIALADYYETTVQAIFFTADGHDT